MAEGSRLVVPHSHRQLALGYPIFADPAAQQATDYRAGGSRPGLGSAGSLTWRYKSAIFLRAECALRLLWACKVKIW